MSGTALENGLKHDWYIDERAEPEKATRAAAKYLKTLYDMFGDWHLALASYNGGPGRVQSAIKRSGGVKDFWRLSASAAYLPRETRDYVPLILAADDRRPQPGAVRHGHRAAAVEAPNFDNGDAPVAVDLRRVAEWAGTSGPDDPGAESRASPLDDAGSGEGLRAEGAGGPGGDGASRSRGLGPGRHVAELAHRAEGRDAAHDRDAS